MGVGCLDALNVHRMTYERRTRKGRRTRVFAIPDSRSDLRRVPVDDEAKGGRTPSATPRPHECGG